MLRGRQMASRRGSCTKPRCVPTLARTSVRVNSLPSPWYVSSTLTQYIIFNLGMSNNFGGIDWDNLNKLWPFEMVIDWVRVYQDPEAINVGCDTPDYPTKDYIEKHIEAYTNSNLTLWGNTPEEGGYGAEWPLNRLYSKGCKGTRSTQPGDADQPSAVAPNIASSSVTIGIYSTREGQDPSITKHTPIPGAPGAVPSTSAPAPTATA